MGNNKQVKGKRFSDIKIINRGITDKTLPHDGGRCFVGIYMVYRSQSIKNIYYESKRKMLPNCNSV